MADLLNAIFYSFWTFLGTVILLGLFAKLVWGLVAIVAATVSKGRVTFNMFDRGEDR